MSSTYSAEGIVDSFMHQYRVRQTFLAKVSGVCSASTLSAWLKGETRLSQEKQKTLVDCVRTLRAVADSMPIPAAFRDIHLWAEIVRKYEARIAQGGTLEPYVAPEPERIVLKADVLAGKAGGDEPLKV
jgi:hypothetical protein